MLPPSSDTVRAAPVSAGLVPLIPGARRARAGGHGAAGTQAGRQAEAAVDAAREAALRAREAHLQRREEELAEQRRVLAEQARLLQDTRAEMTARSAATGPLPGRPLLHSRRALPFRRGPSDCQSGRASVCSRPRPLPARAHAAAHGFWQRVRRALVGDEAALEERS